MILTPWLQDPAAVPIHPPAGLWHYFACTGFVGPLLLVLGGIAVVLAVRRSLELRLSAMAPENVQRLLEQWVREGQSDQALAQANASRTTLGELVAAGLLLRGTSLDEMLANTERGSVKESLRMQARVVVLARLGTTILLVALLGTVMGLMSMMSALAAIKQPLVGDFATGIGESLASTAIGLLFALCCYQAYGALSARVVTRLLHVREIAEELLVAAHGRPPADVRAPSR
ncbi:MAG TPA: MotA/TolQ/ExbB proton channel family protein [Planctomycetota bacterium]